MEDKKIPYLCGGTLFFLLVQTKKPRTNAREREKGVKDHLSDPEMMEGLIQAITGNYTCVQGGSLKKNTSQFRECQIDGSVCIPFNDNATFNSYDYDVVNNYDSVLQRMLKFTDNFLDPSKAAWLVRVLLDVIEHDARDDVQFYTQQNGVPLSKPDLLGTTHFEFQSFLIGIVHYILMNRSYNISGQATLEAWGSKESGHERKLGNDFLLGSSRKINVDWYTPIDKEAIAEDPETDDGQEDESEYAKIEVVDECSDKGEQEAKIINQSVLINNGSGVQIGVNYGTINLSPRQNTRDN